MDSSAPQFDEELLDRYALIFARMALDKLMAELQRGDGGDRAETHAQEKCADDRQS
jgi:hypothetical protein